MDIYNALVNFNNNAEIVIGKKKKKIVNKNMK